MRFLVAGSINVETTVPVEGFPMEYLPVRYPAGIASAVSGVGWNIALALHTLGSEVTFLSLVGRDAAGRMVREEVGGSGIAAVLEDAPATPQSVILYDPSGRRRAETDLKGTLEAAYPFARFDAALTGCELAVLANVNWTRPLLARAAAAGVPIATDLHDIASLDNPYDADYLQHAAVLFCSGENLPEAPERFCRRVWERADPEVVGIGLGADGALLAGRRTAPVVVPAPRLRPVVSTIGAGDALFAAFLHFRRRLGDTEAALRRAATFAAWKVGEASASAGFLTEAEVEALCG